MSKTVIKSISGINFVDLGAEPVRKIYISNTDTTAITVSLIVGENDIIGTSSIGAYSGAYYIKNVQIPVGVTLELEDIKVSRLYTSIPQTSAGVSDPRLMIALGDAGYTADVVIER